MSTLLTTLSLLSLSFLILSLSASNALPGEWDFTQLDPLTYMIDHQDGPSFQKPEMIQFLKQNDIPMDALTRRRQLSGENGTPNADNLAPEQLRWSLTTVTNSTPSYSITWVTFEKSSESQLQLKCNGEEVKTLSGKQWTYKAGATHLWMGWLHRVENVQFPQNVGTCQYRVGMDSHWSDWNQVKPIKSQYPYRMAVYGDMGTVIPAGGMVTNHIIDQHKKNPLDLIFHVGDLAYAGTGSKWEFEFLWDVYSRQLEPLTKEIPFIAGVGNHEKYYDFAAFKNRFDKPQNGDKTFYFSFDVGKFHFVSGSSEAYVTPFAIGSEQWKWIDSDMKEANERGQTIIFAAHRPMYSSEKSAHTMTELQTHIEPLLRKHNVVLYLNGHMHCYERTVPITDVQTFKKVDPSQRVFHTATDLKNATMHLTVGTAGAWVYEKFNDEPWSVLHRENFGFGVLNLVNETTLHFEMFETFHHPDKAVDEFYIVHDA